VWTVPVALVSVPAAAYAVSGCVDAPAVMGPVHATPTGASFPPSDLTATIAFSASGYPSGGPSAFLVEPIAPFGYYTILNHPGTAVPGGAITMTMTFSRPVSNLSLSVYDIDREEGIDIDWADHVVVNTPGYTIPARDADIVGAGTAADPLRNATNGQGVATENFATLLWAGPVAEVQLTYLLGGTTVKENGQDVGVTNVGFTC
jgi:hypothetical protein